MLVKISKNYKKKKEKKKEFISWKFNRNEIEKKKWQGNIYGMRQDFGSICLSFIKSGF